LAVFPAKTGYSTGGAIDGQFGLKTEDATKIFQLQRAIKPISGRLDEATLDVATSLGYLVKPDNYYDGKRTDAYPPKPNLNSPSNASRNAELGCFKFKQLPRQNRDDAEEIVIGASCDGKIADWRKATIVDVSVPQLAFASDYHGVITCHRLVAPHVQKLFSQWEELDLLCGLLDESTVAQYKRLGRIICDAREGGLIDWDAIEDRTREVNTHSAWKSPASIIGAAAKQYQEDPWRNQMHRPEVWIEKEALLGVIEGVCTELRLPYFAHRGNNSQTLQYEAGKRFARFLDQGLIPLVLHLADHDPNGIDMTRDVITRLELYAKQEIEVRRIALNLDQERRYRPPASSRRAIRGPPLC
jgi:hypothetical protein